jgi:hypothetical protein
MTDDRRRSTRIELLGKLHGHSVSLNLPVKVVQISLGGMAIETGVPFPVGAVHTFRLTLGDDSTTEIAGRVMHSRATSPAGSAEPVYITGIQFVDADPDAADGVGDIIDRVR